MECRVKTTLRGDLGVKVFGLPVRHPARKFQAVKQALGVFFSPTLVEKAGPNLHVVAG
jgi:hypothetical protein